MMTKNLLKKVARFYGIQTSYKNIDNQFIKAPVKTLVKMISDLSTLEILDDSDLHKAFDLKKQKIISNKLPKVMILWRGESQNFTIYTKKSANLQIELKDNLNNIITCQKIAEVDHKDYFKNTYSIQTPELKIGYHHFNTLIEDEIKKIFVVIAPNKLEINQGKKQWGPFVPLYALKSDNDWGIGSFRELKEIAPLLKEHGASWVSLLPILAGNFDPSDCDPSPYSSLTRLFWNEIYLDIPRLLLKYDVKEATDYITQKSFLERKEKLRALEFVDYYECYRLKKEVLLFLSDAFFEKNYHRSNEYKSFETQNPMINDYAKFRSNDERIQNFHKFCQFEMNIELSLFKQTTGLSLYMDYPVGVNDAGFDFSKFTPMFFKQVSVGAPPEPVFALGQDWGFPSFHPDNMINDEYSYFRESLVNHLKYSSILRLDHVMGLHRIYSVPKGYGGENGAYLRFPKDHLFGITITQAYLAGVDVIGENLGTVPLEVEQTISKRNLNGMWVMQCETWRSKEAAIAAINENQLICINTHDMPMLKSFIDTTDLDLVLSLNILTKQYRDKFKIERSEQMQQWQAHDDNFLTDLYSKLAQAKAKYFVVNLEDLWSEERPQNIPGTWKEYANWRGKFSVSCEDFKSQSKLLKCLEALKEFRG